MPKTMFVKEEGPANSLHLSCNRNFDQVVIAGRTVFKIYSILEESFVEVINLRSGKDLNLDCSCNDVVWSNLDENLIATAASNGAVVIWNLGKPSKSKQHYVFTEHSRTVNKVSFHPMDVSTLASGSQDGIMKFFDLRTCETVTQFNSNTGSVRDLQFNPHSFYQFASVTENGRVQLWDMRKPDRCEKWWPAHSDHVFACDWHPEVKGWLATGGRDKSVKIWDTSGSKASLEHTIYTIGSVGQVKWRPQRREHICSSALVIDFAINVWDIRKPYLPFAAFESHQDVATGIVWRGSPHVLLSTSKDGTLFQHVVSDASRPADHANPSCIAINGRGDILHATRDLASISSSTISEKMVSQTVKTLAAPQAELNNSPSTGNISGGVSLKVPSIFRRSSSINDLFCASTSHFNMFSINEKVEFDVKSPSNVDLFPAVTDMRWFVESARRYILSGASLEDMCENNAKVAFELSRNQVGQTWLTLKTLFGSWLDSVMMDVATDAAAAAKIGLEESLTNGLNILDDRLRHMSTKVRHHSASLRERKMSVSASNGDHHDDTKQNSNKNSGKIRTRRNGSDRQVSGGSNGRRKSAVSGQSEEDSEDDDQSESNELTLTNIASGEMLSSISGDFFGDSELAVLTIEQPVSMDPAYSSGYYNGQGGFNGNHNWELPSEAFDLRHEIRESSSHAEAEEFAQNGDENINEEATVTVTVEDQTSALLCCAEKHALPPWSPKEIIKETLIHYAERGDIQTTVSIYIVLGRDRMAGLFDDVRVESWFLAYIELLQRFQLLNTATEIMNLCPLSSVNQINYQSTTFYSNCTACKKALSRNQCGWWCDRCNLVPNLCAVCHKVVKGLFVWCQGCGHGGHMQHIGKWLETNTVCPTGCGHSCEYE